MLGFPGCSLGLPGLLGMLFRIKFYSNNNSIRSFVFGLPSFSVVEFGLEKSASIGIMSKYGFIYCLVCVTVTVIVFCISFTYAQIV